MSTIQELIEQAETEMRDKKAKELGFVVALPGELYTLTVNRHSSLYIETIDSKWQAWRETYYSNKEKAVNITLIATSENIEYALMMAKHHLEDYFRKRIR